MSTYNKTRHRSILVYTVDELKTAEENKRRVSQKINALQIKPGDKLLIREYCREDKDKEQREYIGTLLSTDDDSTLVVLTCGKKVWRNEKNKRSVQYQDIEEIVVVNKA